MEADRPKLNIDKDFRFFFEIDVPAIIKQVKGDEKALWGIMDAHHMLEHLVLPLRISRKILDFGIFTPEEKLPRQKAFLNSEYAMPQNFPFPGAPPGTVFPLMTGSLAEAKQLLLNEINLFLEDNDNPEHEMGNHPVFGKLEREEWLLFQYKHFMHHFMQFGLV